MFVVTEIVSVRTSNFNVGINKSCGMHDLELTNIVTITKG